MSVFRGAGVAIATPFNKDESVNFDDLGKLIEFQIENGTDAIIICGTTGEASTLSDAEQVSCVRFTVEKTAGRVPVIAGAGSNSTRHAAEMSVACQNTGADAILLVTPYYNKATQNGMVNHYSAVASEIDIPLILYNVPGRTGLNITPKTAYELSKIPNIAGIKEASGDLSQIAQIARLCGPDFSIYSGNDDQITPVMAVGGIGVISVASNIIPKQIHEITDNFLNGNINKAIEIQLKYLGVINALFCEVNPIPVKAALELMGLSKANYRAPLYKMEDSNFELLKKEMENVGLI